MMSTRRAKSTGWAAFDLRQQQKQGIIPQADNEPYPPLTGTLGPSHPYQNFVNSNDLPVKSFTSVVLPSVNFPILTPNKDIEKSSQVGKSSAVKSNKLIGDNSEENSVPQAYQRLKELPSWAEESLIEDIMAAVNNDFDKASTMLKAMMSSENSDDNKDKRIVPLKSDYDIVADNIISNKNKCILVREITDSAELGHPFDYCHIYKDRDSSSGKLLWDDGHMNLILGHMQFIPMEPEWEDDDIYSVHRKDAIRMMRSSSRYSKAASDAYIRGNHLLAHQFSVKAREEWNAADRLHTKAAKEILSIRNCKSDMWRLDLHGLHATEAVHALQKHLQKIEVQVQFHRFTSPAKFNANAGIVHSMPIESSSDLEKLDRKQVSSSRQRPTMLEVITGKGNHSRGHAALPAAIRNFLSENGYHYEEARDGVIMVRPKFRRP